MSGKDYEMVAGLETHVELKTATKIFCGCSTAFGAEPNTQCCPVCTGMPGSLPVLNRQVVEYARSIHLKLVLEGEYGLREFLRAVYPDFDARCAYCYSVRMEAAAKYAMEHGFSSFSTTLLISPYQNHQMLCQIGERAAQKYGVDFLYRDFRPFFRQGQCAARPPYSRRWRKDG